MCIPNLMNSSPKKNLSLNHHFINSLPIHRPPGSFPGLRRHLSQPQDSYTARQDSNQLVPRRDHDPHGPRRRGFSYCATAWSLPALEACLFIPFFVNSAFFGHEREKGGGCRTIISRSFFFSLVGKFSNACHWFLLGNYFCLSVHRTVMFLNRVIQLRSLFFPSLFGQRPRRGR